MSDPEPVIGSALAARLYARTHAAGLALRAQADERPTSPRGILSSPGAGTAGPRRLIAGSVPGMVAVAFQPEPPLTPAETLPLYPHPADRNAAATRLALGRIVDVTA